MNDKLNLLLVVLEHYLKCFYSIDTAFCLLFSGRPYSSTMDLRKQVMSQQSFPGIDTVDHTHRAPQRFLSVPDIHISSKPQKSKKTDSGSKTKLRVSA